MPTIRDVAKEAGVAPITVSRVINNSGYVSDDKRARVTAAVTKLGYVPNTLARSLRSRRTGTLALILTDITNPFWTTVARGVEDAASAAGLNVIFCNTDESEEEQNRYIEVLLQKRVDGILLAPVDTSPEQIAVIQAQDTPVVIIDRRVPGAEVDTVYCDSVDGAYQLTRLLLSLGHKRIALLNGPADVATAIDRLQGFRRAMSEAGIEPDERLTQFGDFSIDSGFGMVQEVLDMLPPPTAVIAANNFIAIGAIRGIRQAGLNIPEDIALVGFDDLPPALTLDPILTAAAQPAYEMGRKATELLLARLSGKVADAYQEIVLPVELIVRQTSGGPITDSNHTLLETRT
ncbi:MAG: LacI family DNA-binding transcriptional regulator [Caldilineales bacterium]|nr:LacI family DNA-binding transcriptional regulator [Caldilineales bacterium]